MKSRVRASSQRGLKFCALLSLAITVGCSRDPEIDEVTQLEGALKTDLRARDPERGLAAFTLPDSSEIASLPQDPLNPITTAKVKLGQKLFHDPILLASPHQAVGLHTISCATCHAAGAGFQSGLRQPLGEGGSGFGVHGEARVADTTYPVADIDAPALKAPATLNLAFQSFGGAAKSSGVLSLSTMGWNGSFGAHGANEGTQSLWTPSTPLETNFLRYDGIETLAIVAQDSHRMDLDTSGLADIGEYQQLFADAFPSFASQHRITQANASLAMGAYIRTLTASHAPFQRFLRGETHVMSATELRGARVFFGKAQCVQCHAGPALAGPSFHAQGFGDMLGDDVIGADPTRPEHLGRGAFTHDSQDEFKFKTPQLYNLEDARFYGHGGSFRSIREVVEYYNRGVPQNPRVPLAQVDPTLRPLHLSETEVADLTNFLRTSLRDPDLHRYVPTSVPSGKCFPNNDPQSRADLNCP